MKDKTSDTSYTNDELSRIAKEEQAGTRAIFPDRGHECPLCHTYIPVFCDLPDSVRHQLLELIKAGQGSKAADKLQQETGCSARWAKIWVLHADQKMAIVFCNSPMNPRLVDADYLAEYQAAKQVGLLPVLISFEDLIREHGSEQAVAQIPEQQHETSGIYRGWMLTPSLYTKLFAALRKKRVRLLTSPKAYRHCHWLPESYSIIKSLTPDTIWVPVAIPDLAEAAVRSLSHFGNKPVIVKDYVKSQKHAWHEACFIPCAADTEHARRVIRRFLQLQGDDLQGGIVLREYVELEMLTTHSRSGMPLAREFRIFVLRGNPLMVTPYWEEGEYGDELPDLAPFLPIIRQIQSPFFTMDIAKCADGRWIIMELGDGQVAGLPEPANVFEFYRALYESSN